MMMHTLIAPKSISNIKNRAKSPLQSEQFCMNMSSQEIRSVQVQGVVDGQPIGSGGVEPLTVQSCM